MWGKYNDPHQWWNLNDYEVICATYQHETEIFLPNEEIEPDPATPP